MVARDGIPRPFDFTSKSVKIFRFNLKTIVLNLTQPYLPHLLKRYFPVPGSLETVPNGTDVPFDSTPGFAPPPIPYIRYHLNASTTFASFRRSASGNRMQNLHVIDSGIDCRFLQAQHLAGRIAIVTFTLMVHIETFETLFSRVGWFINMPKGNQRALFGLTKTSDKQKISGMHKIPH